MKCIVLCKDSMRSGDRAHILIRDAFITVLHVIFVQQVSTSVLYEIRVSTRKLSTACTETGSVGACALSDVNISYTSYSSTWYV